MNIVNVHLGCVLLTLVVVAMVTTMLTTKTKTQEFAHAVEDRLTP